MPPGPNELLITRLRSCQGAKKSFNMTDLDATRYESGCDQYKMYDACPLSPFEQARVRAAEPGVGGLGGEGLGFRVTGVKFLVWGLGFGVWGLGFGVWG